MTNKFVTTWRVLIVSGRRRGSDMNAPSKSVIGVKPGKLDSLPYIRDAVFIVSGRHHSDLNDSSGFP